MTLNSRLDALANDKGRRCSAQRLLDSLPDEERATLEAVLADPAIATMRIHQALQAEGYKIGRPMLQDHRVGRCYCTGTPT